MSLSTERKTELKTLVGELLDEQISDHRRQRLADLLREEEAARDYYATAVSLHAELLWCHEAVPHGELTTPLPDSVDGGPLHFLDGLDEVAEAGDEISADWKTIVLRPLSGSVLPRHLRVRVLTISGLLTLAFCAVFAGFVFWGMQRNPDLKKASVANGVGKPGVVAARITQLREPVWDGPRFDAESHSEIRAGECLALADGLAEIAFVDGARVVIEGPVEFCPEDANRGRLQHGRLFAAVPPEAIGFSVKTPSLTVTDLGTEFGVEVDRQGLVDVAVFDGMVELAPELAPEVPAAAETPSPKSVILYSGQKTRYRDGRRIDTADKDSPPRFVRRLAPKHALAEDGATLVLIDFGADSSPLGWNSVADPTADILYQKELAGSGLRDAGGRPTGWSLTIDDANPFNGVNRNGEMALVGPAAKVFPRTVVQHSFYGNTKVFNRGKCPLTRLYFDGLDPAATYDFFLIASRNVDTKPVKDNRETSYTAVGANEARGTLDAANNRSNIAQLAAIAPDPSGRIKLQVTVGPNNTNEFGFFYLNAMVVREVKNSSEKRINPGSHSPKSSGNGESP